MNRLDKVVVFHPLREPQLEQILDIELGMVQQRVLETAKGKFLFRVTQPAREFLLKEGTDMKYGARHLKRAIERHLVYPLASLLATDQIRLGDVLSVDWDRETGCLIFWKEAEGALVTVEPPQPGLAAAAAADQDGHGREIPASPAVAAVEAHSYSPSRSLRPAAQQAIPSEEGKVRTTRRNRI
jgi:ATP-dependent Clp protease ATP-binding subunit ClpB